MHQTEKILASDWLSHYNIFENTWDWLNHSHSFIDVYKKVNNVKQNNLIPSFHSLS
jgi:hypothetical protein